MPPKSSLTSSFSASEVDNEVVCPLRHLDGSACRKRCGGEKRYRSMQEHIRRAHAEYYIPKLPATEESFQLMINSTPSERPQAAPRSFSESYPAAATAAVALAQLHNHRPDSDFGSETGYISENELRPHTQSSSIELPPIHNHAHPEMIPPFQSPRPRELLPPIMTSSPPGRSSTLPPLHRKERPPRLRKSSITHNSRKAKHERHRSTDNARRLSIEGRKALSAEPHGPAAMAQGKRWVDLLEAATSANEADSDRDLTPIPQSPRSVKRASLPPYASAVHHFDSYKASPLQHALTPPPPDDRGIEPFPSIESTQSSSTSGHNFHIPSSGLSNSDAGTSPTFSPQAVQIYCANCRRISVLRDSYACTECISGFCADCVYALSSDTRRPCPRCQVLGPRYKAFQLDFR
ncbi:MAG: hypothetical protein Q9177_003669 [Variospora cf. flavescens]